jgi:CRISPR system Cascade subunit CasD
MRLFGPMAAWGYEEVGDVLRPSQRHPSRSAVLGLVGAAMGLRWEDGDAINDLARSLKVAVASHGRRLVVQEYRTSQHGFDGRGSDAMTRKQRLDIKHGKTELTERQNVFDGLWRVFLSAGDDAQLLLAIERALKSPVFELCLGRREHPLALPTGPKIISGGLVDAAAGYPPVPKAPAGELQVLYRQMEWNTVKIGDFDLRWDDGFPGAPSADSSKLVADEPFNRKAWSFRERKEFQKRMSSPRPVAIAQVDEIDLENEFFNQETL